VTFAHVGTTQSWDTGASHSYTPNGVGHLVTLVEITKLGQTPMISGLSASNITWTRLTPDFDTSVAATATAAAIWVGKTTSTSPANTTITWTGGGSEPAHWEAEVNEFSSTVGDWALDVYGGIDANGGNLAYPSLTPAGAGELYVGMHYDDSGAAAGSTSGYTYHVTSHGNGALYNPACGSGTQTPTWAGTSVMGGIAALIKEQAASDSGTAAVTLKKMTVAGSGVLKDSGTAAVTLRKMAVAGTLSDNSITQNLFGNVDPGISSTNDASDYTMAMEFEVSADAPLTGIRFWSAPDANGLPVGTAIFNLDTSTVVSGSQDDTPSWSGAAGSGWVKNDYDGSVILRTGTHYAVAILKDSTTNVYSDTANYWTTGGPGASGKTNGVISAPNSFSSTGAVGQDQFHTGGGWVKPDSSFGDSNYWIDVEVRVASDIGTDVVTLKKMTVSGHGYAAVAPLVQEGPAAQTLSPSFHQATQAGNLLVAWLGSNDSGSTAPFSTSSPGWVIAFQGGTAYQWFAVAYKENCSAGETAPTFSDSGGSEPFSKLAEFSGMSLSSVLDQTGSLLSSGTSFSAQASAGDSKSGDLIIGGVYCNSPSIVATASATMTDSSGASVTVHEDSDQPAGAGTILYDFVWGVAGGTTGSSGDEVIVTTSAFTGGTAGIASFKTPSSGVSGTAAVTLKKMTVVASGNVIDSGTAAVTLKKMTVAGSYNPFLNANVDFESGTSPWSASGANAVLTQDSSWAASGTYSAQVSVTGSTSFAGLVSEDITVSGDRLYRVKGTINVPVGIDVQLGVFWYDSGRNFISTDYEEETLTAATPLQFGPNVYKSPSNAAIAVLVAHQDGTTASGVVLNVDDFSIEAIPFSSGDVTLKKMTVAASGNVIDSGTAAVTLKKMTVSVSGPAPVTGTAAVSLRKMTAFGMGKAKISGTIVVTTRKMTTSGFGFAPVFGTISVTMTKMQVSASDGHVVQASSLFIFMQP